MAFVWKIILHAMPLALYLFYFHGLSNYSINVDLNDLIKSSKKFSRVKSNLNLSWNSKSKKHLKKRWKIERNWKGGKRIKWFCFPLGYFFFAKFDIFIYCICHGFRCHKSFYLRPLYAIHECGYYMPFQYYCQIPFPSQFLNNCLRLS